MAETSSVFSVAEATQSEFKQLEPGCYQGTLVAVVVKNFKRYQSEEVEPKCVFTFQVLDDEDVSHYVRSQPMKLVSAEKSAFYKMMSSWKKSTVQDLVHTNVADLLGQPAQVVTNNEEKGDKTYVRLESVLPAKKSQKPGAVADAIPEFIVKDAIEYRLADGITIRTDAQQETVSAAVKQLTVPTQATAKAADEDDEPLPFG